MMVMVKRNVVVCESALGPLQIMKNKTCSYIMNYSLHYRDKICMLTYTNTKVPCHCDIFYCVYDLMEASCISYDNVISLLQDNAESNFMFQRPFRGEERRFVYI